MLMVKISFIGLLVSVFSVSKLNTRVLSVLISLEALMLSLLLFFYGATMIMGGKMHFFLVLLTFAACEAALGLALLVSILRIRSNDYLMSLSTLNFYV